MINFGKLLLATVIFLSAAVVVLSIAIGFCVLIMTYPGQAMIVLLAIPFIGGVVGIYKEL